MVRYSEMPGMCTRPCRARHRHHSRKFESRLIAIFSIRVAAQGGNSPETIQLCLTPSVIEEGSTLSKFFGVRLAIACLALVGTVERASAQGAVAGSLADLVHIVRPGTEVVLVDRDGREVTGVVTAVTPAELTLAAADRARIFRDDEISGIRERRSDSVLDGTLKGFAVGAGTVLGMTVIASSANYSAHGEGLASMFALFGGVGAGIGALIDGAKEHHRTLYRTQRPVTLHWQATPTQVVVGMGVSF